ncbi:sulfotransferase family protein [Campylobacter sp. CNRCH_2016_3089]|uniref:sulfotransferase family protein n=1 Tax=unclassified Campylobacter TaxID=2593542 RepID=UPI0021E6B475|nr:MULTISPECIES: sulfotransferase family protein [unclassified Campylobacter]MCV3473345.1 sulfotransferase family protein [Campylobacter sp. CNRCH_2014_2849]MCV3508166.1 sulfotransferase family protein [Campylobacter sp. CNRCH_2016_3089]
MDNNLIKDFQRKQKCIFIHIPKTAGTSIEKAIFQTDKWLSGHIKAQDYIQSDPKEFKNIFSFGFVRNPHDRLVSAFFYLKKGGGNIEDLQWSQEHMRKYSSFEQFVLDLENIKIRNKIFNWIHFIPQYCFLCDNQKNILVDFIGKVENIHNDFQFVLSKLNIKRTLTISNPSSHRHYLSYYNKTTYKIVYKLYHYDYKLFNYNSEEEKIKEDFSFFFKVQLFLKKICHNLKFYFHHPKKIFQDRT